MSLKKYLNGLIIGKCRSILIFLSRLKKLYFQEKLLKHLILQSYNDIPVARCSIHKHLGMDLDEKLNFGHHITEKIAKTNKGIRFIKKLHNVLLRRALLTIYKCFIRPNLDYGDFINDQPNNGSFCSKIESVQYNAALAITGAIRGTSQTKLYRELRLESLIKVTGLQMNSLWLHLHAPIHTRIYLEVLLLHVQNFV